MFPHPETPPYAVSIYACSDVDTIDADMVSVGTAWRVDRLPDLLELLLAFEEWPPTRGLICSASWSQRM